MKIAIFGKSKHRTRTNLYFQRAFQALGHRAKWIKYRKIRSYVGEKMANWLCKKWMSFYKPDVLFLYAADISYELLEWAKGKMKIILYYEDPQNSTFPKMVKYGKLADLFYITSRGDVALYEKEGIPARYITGGCDPEAHIKIENPSAFYQSDIAFIGRPSAEDRTHLIQKISEKFDLKLWGPGWEDHGLKTWKENAYPEDYQQICSGSRIVLGQNVVFTDLFFSNRIWYTLGCGGFFLTSYTPNMEEIFKRGHHLDWFEGEEECFEKIEYYLDHEEERKEIALNGYKLAHEEYSFEKLADRMLGDIRGIIETKEQ